MTDRKRKPLSTKERLAVWLIAVGFSLLVLLVFSVIFVSVHKKEYENKALAQATGAQETLLAKPGVILDANGRTLADNVKVYRLILDPYTLNYSENGGHSGTIDRTAALIEEAFGVPRSQVVSVITGEEYKERKYLRFGGSNRLFTEEEYNRYQTLKAEADAEDEKKQKETPSYKNHKPLVTGVSFEEEYRRTYPEKELLSKVIGYTTKDGSRGLLGLEYQYDGVLRGRDGKVYRYVDENGKVTEELVEPEDGQILYTSLDREVAAILREEMQKYLAETGGKRVTILVMNPKNGEIIAMASDTDFDLNDPNDLTGLFTEEELLHPEETFLLQEAYKGRMEELYAMSREEQLAALLNQVHINYAVSGSFEPGSTAKALTLATGIETGAIREDDLYYCDGSILADRYTIHCHMPSLCGDLKPIEAFGRSCNVCFVRMVRKIGKEAFVQYQKIFNLGQKTGVDLPGEANTANLIYYENNMNEVELATNSFGQGFNVTMLQLAAAYSSIINGGYYYEPHVVTRIEDSKGNLVRNVEPLLVRRTVSESTAEFMREALKYVVTKGTASGILFRSDYDFGGKTGAAEKLPRGNGNYIVSFIGAAPLHDPKFLLYVTIDEPDVEDQSASAPALQLSSGIYDRLFRYYNVYQTSASDPYSYDWSKLAEFNDSTDSNGTEFIDDPDHTIQWIEDEHN